MQMTDTVKKILANYEGENPGVKGNLARMLMTGKLAGTGKMMQHMMTKDNKYTPSYAAALTAVTAVIGPIIPPSEWPIMPMASDRISGRVSR